MLWFMLELLVWSSRMQVFIKEVYMLGRLDKPAIFIFPPALDSGTHPKLDPFRV